MSALLLCLSRTSLTASSRVEYGIEQSARCTEAMRNGLLSSRSFFLSTTPLYQLLALMGGYRRSRPRPDTPSPLPRTTSRLILRTRLAAPSSRSLRWPHQDLRHSGSTIATRPTRPRTARRPAQELAARGGVRGPKTHLEPPPLARLQPLRAPRRPRQVADLSCRHCDLATRLRRPLRPVRFRDGEQVSGRGLDLSARALEQQVSLDVRDLALALRYACTPSGLSRPTEWRPARGPYPRPLRGGAVERSPFATQLGASRAHRRPRTIPSPRSLALRDLTAVDAGQGVMGDGLVRRAGVRGLRIRAGIGVGDTYIYGHRPPPFVS